MSSEQTVLVAHPSADVYGADLQLLQSLAALVEAGRRVVVVLPADGPLVERITELGVEVRYSDFPVLQKANLRPLSLVRLAARAAWAVPRLRSLIRDIDPSVVYVNTVTLPWWLLAARLARRPVVCHLHEAESQVSRPVQIAMTTPLHLADRIIVISRAARLAMTTAQPGLAARARLVYNGVPGPSTPVTPVPSGRSVPTTRLVTIGRLSPRKAPDLTLEAAAVLRRQGYDVSVRLAGAVFPSYEWYDEELRVRAARDDLAGAVEFAGYVSPIWPSLEDADIVVQPSGQEPFGNAVVEAMLAGRPVVAAAAYGHLESLVDGRTGLLVEPGDADLLADGVRRLIDDPGLAHRLSVAAEAEARARFSVERYGAQINDVLDEIAATRVTGRRTGQLLSQRH